MGACGSVTPMRPTLSPVTRDVLQHCARLWAYHKLAGADAVATGNMDAMTAAPLAEAILSTLTAKKLRDYGHPRGVREVRRELDALVAKGKYDAYKVILRLAEVDAYDPEDPYRDGVHVALVAWLEGPRGEDARHEFDLRQVVAALGGMRGAASAYEFARERIASYPPFDFFEPRGMKPRP